MKLHDYVYLGEVCGKNRRVGVRGGRLFSTPEYKRFIDALVYTMRAKNSRMRWETIEGPVMVWITEKINPRRDIDSLIAPILDAMQRAGVIENDRQVRKVVVHKVDSTEDIITVTVEEMNGEEGA